MSDAVNKLNGLYPFCRLKTKSAIVSNACYLLCTVLCAAGTAEGNERLREEGFL